MLIRWVLSAQEDLRNILQYFINEQDEETGQELVYSLFASTTRLENSPPPSGKPGEIQDTRELVLPKLSYILVYKMNTTTVEIVRVIHTSKLRD